MMTTTAAAAGFAATHPVAVATAKTALTALCRDPSDAERAFIGAAQTVNDVAATVANLGYAAWYRDTIYLSEAGSRISYLPGHAADAVVYSLAAIARVVPKSEVILPIGYVWGRVRSHKKNEA